MSITWVVIFILCYFRGIHNWYLDEVSACSLYKELIWSNKFRNMPITCGNILLDIQFPVIKGDQDS